MHASQAGCLTPEEALSVARGGARDHHFAHLDGCAACRRWILSLGERPSMPDLPELPTVDPQLYTITGVVAQGGMGVISSARDRRLGREVAIKELLGDSPAARARFAREARITARLQHPSIVSLHEAGCWPGGEPFYAMKLVDGRSLERVIAETRSKRLALLPSCLAIADAIAYAHDRKVIHRDLKPSNVLVGTFGETVVIDWGLAKSLAADGDDAEPGPAPSAQGTLAGAIMGTPAFMPPEQARGEAVDERADVYALGAILYHVIAGAPPYRGSAEEVLAQVLAGPPPPLPAGTPAELSSIVARAMARDPAARYRTAQPLAADLRDFQTGQLVASHDYSLAQRLGRWLRRYRLPVAVASVAILLLATTGALSVSRILGEQARAERERRDAIAAGELAEQRGAAAEDLLGFMLGDLRERLEPLGQLSLLDAVAQKARTYYERNDGPGDPQALRRRALARRQLGDVLMAQGDVSGALAQFRQALALLAQAPPDREVRVLHGLVGAALSRQGDTAGARASLQHAVELAQELAGAHPDDPELGHDQVSSLLDLGHLIVAEGELAQARQIFERALVLADELIRRFPQDTQAYALRVGCLRDLGAHLLGPPDPAAVQRLAEALAQLEALLAKAPPDSDRLFEVADSHYELGLMLVAGQRPGDAAGEMRSALATMSQLTAKDPANAIWQRYLAVDHAGLGDALDVAGDWRGALPEYRAAADILAAQAAQHPRDVQMQRDAALAHTRVAGVLLQHDDARGALAAYQAALRLTQVVQELQPDSADTAADVFVAETGLGTASFDLGDKQGALAHYQAALAAAERATGGSFDHPHWRKNVWIAQYNLAALFDDLHDLGKAADYYRKAIAQLEGIVRTHPEDRNAPADLEQMREMAHDCCVR